MMTAPHIPVFPVINNDEIVRELNQKICFMYGACFETNSHGEAFWCNGELLGKITPELRVLGKQLVDRLNEINDGSYELEDNFSKWL